MFLSSLLDSPDPTIFELSMAKNLSGGIQPAFDYLLRTIGERNESVFQIFPWKDELFAVISGIIERHYLALYDGCFAENFYAMKRMKVDMKNGGLMELKNKDKAMSLFGIVLFPYIRTKLAKAHEMNAIELQKIARAQANPQVDTELPTQFELLFRKLFAHALPFSFASLELWSFYMKVLFMFNKTKHFSPLHWMQGIVICRITGDDMRKQMAREEEAAKVRGILGKIFHKSFSFLKTMLVASALIFKLVEWYYSPENQSQRENMQGPTLIPPAPLPPKIRSSGIRMPRDPSLCPLCHEQRVQPAISTSGVAFCYTCIHKFTLEHAQCPVTGIYCPPTAIRRLFEA